MLHNVHEREMAASAQDVGSLLADLGRPGDRIWPGAVWMPMVLDRPLAVGASGGHGPIRYRVTEFEPGWRVRCVFDPACGLDGYHELSVETVSAARCRVRHVLRCRASGRMRPLVPLLVEPVHDALVEDLFDSLERAATGSVPSPAKWPWRVRLAARLAVRFRTRRVEIPAGLASRVETEWGRTDLRDAWAVRSWPGLPADPQVWADAIFVRPPSWVVALMELRQLLVPVVGIERGTKASFATLERTECEVLLGEDAGHLDFRAAITVDEGRVTLSTLARATNARGRGYLRVIRPVHPWVVQGMLAHARRQLGQRAASHSRARHPRDSLR